MRLHALQYLRAVAALAVVYSHSTLQVITYQPFLPHAGDFGVDIFFLISGFIMVYIAKPTDTPKRFMVNRVRRVVPLYWFFTLLMGFILCAAPFVFKKSVFDLPVIIKSLLFIPHYSLVQPDMIWPVVAPGWSLNYEMYFYLMFALSLFAPIAGRTLVISTGITAVFVAAWLLPKGGAINAFYRDAIVFEFVLGMLLALAYKRGFRLSNSIAWICILVGFAILFARFPVPRIFSYGLPSLLILAGTVNCRLPERPFLVLLGDSSYALYLCHIFTLGVCRKILPPLLGEGSLAAIGFVIISLFACLVSGIAVHFIVDNWLLRRERLANLPGFGSGSH